MGLTRINAGQISNIDYKQAVRVITLSNINLSGGAPTVVDGVTLVLSNRILVAGQNTTSQNGIYYVSTLGTGANGTWSRTIDADATGEIAAGMIVMVTEGTSYKDSQWVLTANNPIVVGTTELTFAQNSAFAFGNIYANGTAVVANSAGDTLTLTAGTNIQITGNISAKSVTIGVTGFNLNSISNGTSNVNVVSSGGNVTVGVGGTSNVAVFSSAGANIAGTLGVTGNITSGNVQGTTGTFTNVGGTLSTAAQTNITSVGTLTSLAVTGNITSGNLSGTSIVGTLATAAQPNIASVGSLTGLTVSNVSGLVNFITTSNVSLGNISNLHITGGSNNQVLTTNGSGGLSWTTANGNVIIDSFAGNGSQTIFALSSTPTSNNYVQVNIDGITQLHNAFTVSSANVTLSAAPFNGSSVEITTFNLGGGGGSSGLPRVTSITGAAGGTITPVSASTDQYNITALGAAATFAIPAAGVDAQKLMIRIKDDGTARALSWTTSAGGYRVIGTTLPTTTVVSKVTYVGLIYNSQDSYWDVVAVGQQV